MIIEAASNWHPSTTPDNKVELLFTNFTRSCKSLAISWRNRLIPVLSLLIVIGSPAAIQSSALAQTVGASGLPLPRFVSLKSKRVNMRIGPGRDYQVQWLYIRKSLPMEIIQEFGNWRKVRDPNGVEGWILHSLLSGERAAIITPWDMSKNGSLVQKSLLPTINMYGSNSKEAEIIARLESGSLAKIKNCQNDWCRLLIAVDKNTQISGYVPQTMLWGVYPDEKIKN